MSTDTSEPRAARKTIPYARRFASLGAIPRVSRTAEIRKMDGTVVFRQEGVECPSTWSQQAVNVVASKYLYGDASKGDDPGEGGRESTVYMMVDRVASTIAKWGLLDGYFDGEDSVAFHADLRDLLLHQCGSFNSPVWFNVGLSQKYGLKGDAQNFVWDAEAGAAVRCADSYRNPQASACFIQSVTDDMGGIMDLARSEAMLFKNGSGTGTDLSTLRSTREKLAGGGTPSGPVSFMRVYDAIASVIKSGGKTRRAAKMQTLKCWHPDILEFIECKPKEDRKARALIESGAARPGLSGHADEAYSSVAFQNANLSVRVTDEFLAIAEGNYKNQYALQPYPLQAVTTGEIVGHVFPDELLDKIAEGTWLCGDPGLQYEDTIQRWHTCPNTAPVMSSNPCCFVAETLVQTAEGLIPIGTLREMYDRGETLPLVFSFDLADSMPKLRRITRAWLAGRASRLVEVRTQRGHVFRCTPEHRFLLRSGEYVSAEMLKPGDRLRKIGIGVNDQRSVRRLLNHKSTPDHPSGTEYLSRWMWAQANGPIPENWEVHHKNDDATDDRLSNFELVLQEYHDHIHAAGEANPRFIAADARILVETWEAIEAKPRVTHLSGPAVTVGRWNKHIRDNGLKGVVPLANLKDGGRIRGMSWQEFAEWIEAQKAEVNDRIESITSVNPAEPVEVFDIEVEGTNNFAIGSAASLSPVVVHNSEYMFIDDSACNLASINLVKFLNDDGTFDVEAFRSAVRVFIVAQEILVDRASYPTAKIAENSHRFRPLGLGYANLGGLLMVLGIPYDSKRGRDLAAAITATMHAEASLVSATLASAVGPYDGFAENRHPHLVVHANHLLALEALKEKIGGYGQAFIIALEAAKAMRQAERLADKHGFRNSQVTLLAPTGTIAFMMDCDTTGIEPPIALVAYKELAGGGTMKIVNNLVSAALRRLGYGEAEAAAIEAKIVETGTAEGSGVRDEHLPVFDCALPAGPGGRSISWRGHVEMMAAVQPFLSGAISKTINMPADATVEDIREAYLLGWKLGLKAVAIYRDGSKGVQPLKTSKDDATTGRADAAIPAAEASPAARRERLPDTRESVTHKFEIQGHEGYVTVGLYPDGRPGEIFVKMAKEGSTMAGWADLWATMVSISLQNRVPLAAICEKFKHVRFEPSGFTKNPEIPICTSVADYIAKWLERRFGGAEAGGPVPVGVPLDAVMERVAPALVRPNSDAPPCPNCGSITTRAGACYACRNCGTSLGCG